MAEVRRGLNVASAVLNNFQGFLGEPIAIADQATGGDLAGKSASEVVRLVAHGRQVRLIRCVFFRLLRFSLARRLRALHRILSLSTFDFGSWPATDREWIPSGWGMVRSRHQSPSRVRGDIWEIRSRLFTERGRACGVRKLAPCQPRMAAACCVQPAGVPPPGLAYTRRDDHSFGDMSFFVRFFARRVRK